MLAGRLAVGVIDLPGDALVGLATGVLRVVYVAALVDEDELQALVESGAHLPYPSTALIPIASATADSRLTPKI